jgi:hypothetical protein
MQARKGVAAGDESVRQLHRIPLKKLDAVGCLGVRTNINYLDLSEGRDMSYESIDSATYVNVPNRGIVEYVPGYEKVLMEIVTPNTPGAFAPLAEDWKKDVHLAAFFVPLSQSLCEASNSGQPF